MADTLDLRTSERAKANLDQGTFEVRSPRELDWDDTGRIVTLAKALEKLEGNLDDPEYLNSNADILQKIVAIVLVDVPREKLLQITPSDLRSVLDFFNALRTETDDEPDLSESVSSSSPGANDSSDLSEVA